VTKSNIKLRAKAIKPVKIVKIIIFNTKGCLTKKVKTETKKVITGAIQGVKRASIEGMI
jgi:hypothetical protein